MRPLALTIPDRLLTEAERRAAWKPLRAYLLRRPDLHRAISYDWRLFSSPGHLRRALAGTTLPTGRTLRRLLEHLQTASL